MWRVHQQTCKCCTVSVCHMHQYQRTARMRITHVAAPHAQSRTHRAKMSSSWGFHNLEFLACPGLHWPCVSLSLRAPDRARGASGLLPFPVTPAAAVEVPTGADTGVGLSRFPAPEPTAGTPATAATAVAAAAAAAALASASAAAAAAAAAICSSASMVLDVLLWPSRHSTWPVHQQKGCACSSETCLCVTGCAVEWGTQEACTCVGCAASRALGLQHARHAMWQHGA